MNWMKIVAWAYGVSLLSVVALGDEANNPCTKGEDPGLCWVWKDCAWVYCPQAKAGEKCCPDYGCKTVKEDEPCCVLDGCSGGTCAKGGGKGKMSGRGAPPSGARSAAEGVGFVDFRFQLGQLLGEESAAGYIWLATELPSTNAASPRSLQVLRHSLAEIDSVWGANGLWLAFAPSLDMVISNISSSAYMMGFYAKGQVDGAGNIATSAVPLAVWRIEDPDFGATGGTRLRLTKFMEGQTNSIVEYESISSSEMVSREGNGLREEHLSWTWPGEDYYRVDTHEIRDGIGNPAERIVRKYRHFRFGDKIVEEWKGTEGEEVLSYALEYGEDESKPGEFGKVTSIRKGDGSWRRMSYDLEGRETKEIAVWLDGDTNALESESAVTAWDYTCVDSRETPWFNDRKWRMKMECVAGQWVSTTYRAYYDDGDSRMEIQEEAAASNAVYGAEANRRTVKRLNGTTADARIRLRPLSVVHPDGTEDVWQYKFGNYLVSSPAVGTFIEQTGGEFIEVTETLKANLEEPYKSTRAVSVLDTLGQEVQAETWVCTGSNQWERMDWQTISRDEFGRELVRRYANGLTTETTWNCCGKESETKPDGQSWSYVQDMLGRTIFSIKEDGPTEATVYDAAGKVLSKTMSGGGLSLSTSNRYDLAGRLVKSWDEAGLSTTFEYGERIETVTRPGGATEITARFRDGNVKSVTGTGVVPTYYEYGIVADGGQRTKIYTGSTNSPAWSLMVKDHGGRTVRSERPGFGGGVVTNTFKYDAVGRLVQECQTSEPDIIFQYNVRGEIFRIGTDVNINGALDLASMDRIQEIRSEYAYSGSNWFHQQTTILYPFNNSANTFTASIKRTQVGGSGCACEGGLSELVDARSNISTRLISIDPVLKRVTETLTHSGITNAEISVIANGRIQARTSPTGAEYHYRYDDLGRQIEVVDPRTGTNRTVYLASGRVDYVEDAAGFRTTYGYDAATGRRISVTDALTNTIYAAYDLQGRLTNVWGATYPVAYEYDAYGRMSALKTWRDTNGTPDIARWYYDEGTGLLTNKVYADGKGPSYRYDEIGRLTDRIWTRGVTNSYAYDVLGQLVTIDYSDETPNVTFVYDRMGRPTAITDGTGVRGFAYDSYLQLQQETNYLAAISRTYDNLGRPQAVDVGEFDIRYGYDDYGRFISVTSTVHGVYTHQTQHQYVYLNNSALLALVSNGNMITAFDYEPRRDLRTEIDNKWGTNSVSSFAYSYDAVGRRTTRVDSDVTTNQFGFNLRSELVAAIMGTNTYGYVYDAIGNRISATNNDATTVYAVNELNQYTNIVPSAGDPAYDLDGNMLSDGAWIYSWDAENRLVRAGPVVTNVGSVRLHCAYDFMSRRVQKEVENWDGSVWSNTLTVFYTYDGWNLVCEDRSDDLKNNYYVWGLDLSGTLQGAGGVGGLLARVRADNIPQPLYYSCDANGNVADVLDKNGAVVAHYEYDGFGNTIVQLGPQVDATPFRFSTKYCDGETGLYYYGYRYYDPKHGRWLSIDPRESQLGGGEYTMLSNDSVNMVDLLGLTSEIYTKTDFTYEKIKRLWSQCMCAFVCSDCIESTCSWKAFDNPEYVNKIIEMTKWAKVLVRSNSDWIRILNDILNVLSYVYGTTFLNPNDIPPYNAYEWPVGSGRYWRYWNHTVSVPLNLKATLGSCDCGRHGRLEYIEEDTGVSWTKHGSWWQWVNP